MWRFAKVKHANVYEALLRTYVLEKNITNGITLTLVITQMQI